MRRLTISVMQVAIILLWSTAFGLARAGTLGAGLLTISPWSVVVAMVLAGTGGIAGTLSRAQRAEKPLTWRELGADVFVSLVTGLVVFFIAEWLGWPVPLEAAAITLAGFGGVEVLRRLLGRGLSAIDQGKAP